MFTFQHFRFSLESKTPLQMPVHNKGNVIRGGFGSAFRRLEAAVLSKNYLVNQRILMMRSTDSNSGSPVNTVAFTRWAVATQKASA